MSDEKDYGHPICAQLLGLCVGYYVAKDVDRLDFLRYVEETYDTVAVSLPDLSASSPLDDGYLLVPEVFALCAAEYLQHDLTKAEFLDLAGELFIAIEAIATKIPGAGVASGPFIASVVSVPCRACGTHLPPRKTAAGVLRGHEDRLANLVTNDQVPGDSKEALWYLVGQAQTAMMEARAVLLGYCSRFCLEDE